MLKTECIPFLNEVTTSLLDELFDGVYIIDRERKILFWNSGAETISGYNRSQMVGLFCHEGPLKHKDESDCYLCEKQCPAFLAMEHDRPETAVVYMHTAQDADIPVETHIKPLKNNEGQIVGAIEIFRDITYWKDVEKLSQEKSRLMGILAHDMRNPLSVVHSYAAILQHYEDGQVQYIGETLRRRVKYALALIDDLLDAQAIEQGEVGLHVEEVDVNGLLQMVAANFVELAREKDIELVFTPAAGAVMLTIDPIRLEEVINNLLSNAIHYSHRRTQVILAVESTVQGVAVSVKDHGLGISESDKNKLFQVFGKTSNRPTAGEGSHGLGLYIVKKIVDLFNGTITVESQPGQGSTFTVFFPYSL